MAPGARIVFTSFAARTDPMLAAWSRFQSELEGADAGSLRSRATLESPERSPGQRSGRAADRLGAQAGVRAGAAIGAQAAGAYDRGRTSGGVVGTAAGTPGPPGPAHPDARILAAQRAAALAEPAVVWRLLAPNNRELARSAHLYRGIADAERHATALQNAADDLEVSLVLGPRPGMRGWIATHRGVVVLTCGRWYGGAAANSESAAAAVQLVATAAIARSPGSAATLVGSA